MSFFKPRNCYRVRYRIQLPTSVKTRDKYAPTEALARLFHTKVSAVESACKFRMAAYEDIVEWIEDGYLKPAEAGAIFPGFSETHQRQQSVEIGRTDYDLLEREWSGYSAEATAGSGGETRNQQSSLAHGRWVLTYLRQHFPDLSTFDASAAQSLKAQLESEFKAWTIYTRFTKLRLILDQAIRLNMIKANPARGIKLAQPKRAKAYRILTRDEVDWVLEKTLEYRGLISGGLPTAVRMGLYCGLRDIEMVWFSWDWVQWERGVIELQETYCPVTSHRWIPKDHEARTVPAPTDLLDFLEGERSRQESEGLLNQFVLPAGGNRNSEKCKLSPGAVTQIKADAEAGKARAALAREYGVSWNMINHIVKGDRWATAGKSKFLGKPLDQSAPQKAFFKMMDAEGRVKTVRADRQEADFTLYSLRHTFCTTCLRKEDQGGRDLDIKTVQELMGHSDVRVTEQYLRAVDMEQGLTEGIYRRG